MKLEENRLYREDVGFVASLSLPWQKLTDRSVLITGASGLVGSFLVDVLMERNATYGQNCVVYAVGRNENNARIRFNGYWDSGWFQFIAADINQPLKWDGPSNVDYVLHLASNTHPVAYATDPIGTILTNVFGTNNMLQFAVNHHAECMAFASSNEIYGENRGDVELFDEAYCGYLDSNTLRAGYPESKRCGEALCQAYRKQEDLAVVIPRLTRSYGPTVLLTDTKAINQFIRKGLAGEDIVLKSEGKQYYSYTYVADAVSGLLTVFLSGVEGEAYNIADESGDITLRDLAAIIADYAGRKVVFELPDEVEKAGYSVVTKARLDGSKLRALGWRPMYTIREGILRTLDILKEIG